MLLTVSLFSQAKYRNHVVTQLLFRKWLPMTTRFAARMSVDIPAKHCKDNKDLKMVAFLGLWLPQFIELRLP